jgi:hypothetical protein
VPSSAPTPFTYLCLEDDWTIVSGTWSWDGCQASESALESSAVAALESFSVGDFILTVNIVCTVGGDLGVLFRGSDFSSSNYGGAFLSPLARRRSV